MIRRLPIIPTIIVAAAAAVMIGLGVWQLQRAEWKEGLLARYAKAEQLPPIVFPVPGQGAQLPLFQHATAMCARVVGRHAQAGESRSGEPGYVQTFDCLSAGEPPVPFSVEAGWSKNPNATVNWPGGLVSGIVAPDRRTRMRLVAGSAPPGLEPSALPSLRSIPNNHRFYALQWFFFVGAASLIYGLAIRKRLTAEDPAQ